MNEREQIEAEMRERLEDSLRVDDQAVVNAGTAYVVAALPQQPLPSNGVSLPGIRAAITSYLKEVERHRWRSFTSEELRDIIDAFDVWGSEAGSLTGDRARLREEITAELASRGLEVSLWAELVPLGRGRINPQTGVEAKDA